MLWYRSHITRSQVGSCTHDQITDHRSHVTEGAGVHITCRTLDLRPSKTCP
jgi:hypothetical protein